MEIDRDVRIASLDLVTELLQIANLKDDMPAAITLEQYFHTYAQAVLTQARRIAREEVRSGFGVWHMHRR